jgi:hypothetical protein
MTDEKEKIRYSVIIPAFNAGKTLFNDRHNGASKNG